MKTLPDGWTVSSHKPMVPRVIRACSYSSIVYAPPTVGTVDVTPTTSFRTCLLRDLLTGRRGFADRCVGGFVLKRSVHARLFLFIIIIIVRV
jgi:hypothetical protein